MNEGTCRSCGKRILWVKTASGRAMPLDPDPCPDGNLIISPSGIAVTFNTDSPPAQERYKAHFATCPHADAHRKAIKEKK